ncbi:undecaprenyl/decaprenyl-phosphate alpha-N-acetylglucosaminyl 1-phosphate transferase [Nitrospirales bacterium NOB]|nr:MAG: putative phospho-N-acetylmuramoyl-pentapeptide-transferase [Nitrospira sp. OLB3]MBV6470672.1 putative undecaprenyl-phosphate N-acetylglucosaminyl 1-phosphate transferase [Nitrospirota bacterium]MCE7964911.1 undecaprenyl/decaprenyl-phosphate alpha-N-acetylglucosaminyl 1-phosphate transferase [Nitrospira sp. NTP2]MCK6492353.1 undecaprenyl/decaprenyl-phosphate alpha-N-acetylglucosaminyl 1-phosphate transferase [Nitrospira sp.]MDL1890663.1 undecaprenyl/decaprenyl-phosphate alpha-N-acetylglu
MILLILTFLLAAILAIYGVPIARRAALKFGIVDSPDGRLKHQREPVPYLGGLAIYLSFLVSLAFTFEFRHDVLGIVLAGTLVVMLGLIDDFGVLSPGAKLAGQCLAVFVLIKSGIRIEIASLPDWVDIALTVLWMIGIINAFNLLDIMDGLSAGVGVISAAFLCVVAILNGDQTTAFMLAALMGSLLGFLRYNWKPASIYMGDSGALFIGLMLGALSMIGKYTEGHVVSLLTPVLILGMPIFDTLFVMYIRFLRGLPIFLGSPDHLAIRLRHWGLSVKQVVVISYLGAALLGTIGLLVMAVPQEVAVLLSGATLVGLAVAAVSLTKLKVAGRGVMLNPETMTSNPAERTGLS